MKDNFDCTGEHASPGEHWNALRSNFLTALKLAFGRTIAPERLTISWWQAIVFAALGLLPPLLYDLTANGVHGEVAWENIPDALFHLSIFLVAAAAAAYALGRGESVLWIFQILLMIAFVVDLFHYSLYSMPLTGRTSIEEICRE